MAVNTPSTPPTSSSTSRASGAFTATVSAITNAFGDPTRRGIYLFARERVLWDEGYGVIAGVDEAGRAAWAGPLVAAAVILPHDFHFGGIGDGKVLTAKQRERAHERVIAEATPERRAPS